MRKTKKTMIRSIYYYRLTLEAPRDPGLALNSKAKRADRESFDSQAHEYEVYTYIYARAIKIVEMIICTRLLFITS